MRSNNEVLDFYYDGSGKYLEHKEGEDEESEGSGMPPNAARMARQRLHSDFDFDYSLSSVRVSKRERVVAAIGQRVTMTTLSW